MQEESTVSLMDAYTFLMLLLVHKVGKSRTCLQLNSTTNQSADYDGNKLLYVQRHRKGTKDSDNHSTVLNIDKL